MDPEVTNEKDDSFDTEIKFPTFSKAGRSSTVIQPNKKSPKDSRQTPSPKKLLRSTNDCMNVHLLLKDDDDKIFEASEDEEENDDDEEPNVFKDEFPELSEKMKIKAAKGTIQRKPRAEPEGNYVKANLKRKRFASKKGGNANVKRFKRFKRK